MGFCGFPQGFQKTWSGRNGALEGFYDDGGEVGCVGVDEFNGGVCVVEWRDEDGL